MLEGMPVIMTNGRPLVRLVGTTKIVCLTLKKLESHQCVVSEYAGSDGPVAISGGNNMRNPLYRAFIDAGVEAGYAKPKTITVFGRRALGKSL